MYHYSIIPVDTSSDLSLQISALPQWRREQALAFRFENGRRECAQAYLLLCRMLHEHYGISDQPEFAIGEHGKPSLVFHTAEGKRQGAKLTFNISHCKQAIGCVVSDSGDVGIDVECTGRYDDSLAAYCMSDEENAQIHEAPNPDALFTELWTRKEALLKCTGEGITDDLKTCLASSRTSDVSMESGVNMDRGYAWAVVTKRQTTK